MPSRSDVEGQQGSSPPGEAPQPGRADAARGGLPRAQGSQPAALLAQGEAPARRRGAGLMTGRPRLALLACLALPALAGCGHLVPRAAPAAPTGLAGGQLPARPRPREPAVQARPPRLLAAGRPLRRVRRDARLRPGRARGGTAHGRWSRSPRSISTCRPSSRSCAAPTGSTPRASRRRASRVAASRSPARRPAGSRASSACMARPRR